MSKTLKDMTPEEKTALVVFYRDWCAENRVKITFTEFVKYVLADHFLGELTSKE